MSDQSSINPDERREFEKIVGRYRGEMFDLPDIDSPTPATIRQNRRELLPRSFGIELSSFAPGSKLFLQTIGDNEGVAGAVNITLTAWPNEDRLSPGQSILAVLDYASRPVLNELDYMIIHGPAVYPEPTEEPFLGQIRENYELAVTPLHYRTGSQLFFELEHGIWRETSQREQRIAELNVPKLYIPAVTDVYLIDAVTKETDRQHWQHPKALES